MIKLKHIVERKYDVFRGDDKPFASNKFNVKFIGHRGYDTVGFWFSNNEDAAGFFGEHVRRFRISLNNPLIVTSEEFSNAYPNGPSWFAQKAKSSGHDGVIIQDIVDGDRISTVYCVFSPSQIEKYE